MKVTVSIPDDVFKDAESVARALKSSRSAVYSRALREFLARHAPDRVTEEINRVVAQVGDVADPFTGWAVERR